MIKSALIILLALVMFGCTTMSVDMVSPDGTRCKGSYTSGLKAFDKATGSICGATVTADKSGSDQLSQALTRALIRGLQVPQ